MDISYIALILSYGLFISSNCCVKLRKLCHSVVEKSGVRVCIVWGPTIKWARFCPRQFSFCLLHVIVNSCRESEVRGEVNNITSAPSLVKIGSLIYTLTQAHTETAWWAAKPIFFPLSLSRKGSWPNSVFYFFAHHRNVPCSIGLVVITSVRLIEEDLKICDHIPVSVRNRKPPSSFD